MNYTLFYIYDFILCLYCEEFNNAILFYISIELKSLSIISIELKNYIKACVWILNP